jgi:secreted PhoX family phosphatase
MSQVSSKTRRRTFIKFLGGSLGLSFVGQGLTSKKAQAASLFSPSTLSPVPLRSLKPTQKDDLVCIDGLHSERIISWGDKINQRGDRFGFNNDYLHWTKIADHEGILWANHEYLHPLFIHGEDIQANRKSKQQIDKERKEIGGSLIHLVRDPQTSLWKLKGDSSYNRRLDANTPIPLINEKGQQERMTYGTLGNCAGGVIPWSDSLLTCEEGYDLFYGNKDRPDEKNEGGQLGWEAYYPHQSEDYGWVVEVNPYTGGAKKYMSMGRFAHEACAVRVTSDGRIVAYTGDDRNGGFFYKFISQDAYSFARGTLYVADTLKGEWIALDWEKNPILKKHFKDQGEVLTFARLSAELVGATPLDRPEDVEIHPVSGDIFVTFTNNLEKKNYFGSIVCFKEKSNDPISLTFVLETFMLGGEDSQMACPDNLCFDQSHNLWMTSDISGSVVNKPPYQSFGNNSLFYIPLDPKFGDHQGQCFRFASAPVEAEFTGPCFSHDGKTLFLSIQHPGEKTSSFSRPTSQWPHLTGDHGMPRPSVVQLFGPLMNKLNSGKKM